MMIDPATLAFDFDGVLADTMSLFLEIARDEYNINGIGYDDITCYALDECLNIKPEVIAEIIDRLLKGDYSQPLHPMAGAAEVLVQISRYRNPIPLVTSRPHPGPINDWIINTLPLDPGAFEIIATGAAEAKADELINRSTGTWIRVSASRGSQKASTRGQSRVAIVVIVTDRIRSPRNNTVITFEAIAPGMQPTSTMPVRTSGSENRQDTPHAQRGMIVYWLSSPLSARVGAWLKARTCSGCTSVPTKNMVTAKAGWSAGCIHNTASGKRKAKTAPATIPSRTSICQC